MYFCYDPNGSGFTLHSDQEQARKEATQALDAEREEAAEGWSDEVMLICWGLVCEKVMLTREASAPPGSNFDLIQDFELKST